MFAMMSIALHFKKKMLKVKESLNAVFAKFAHISFDDSGNEGARDQTNVVQWSPLLKVMMKSEVMLKSKVTKQRKILNLNNLS